MLVSKYKNKLSSFKLIFLAFSLKYIGCQFKINIQAKPSQTYAIVSDNRAYNSIFVLNMTHGSAHTEESEN